MSSNDSIVRPELPPGIKLDANVYVKMRDGVKIAVDVYRPAKEGRYPGILSTSPYIKEIQQQPTELSHSIEAGATQFLVPKGYVHVCAQVRGSGLSQGQFNWYDEVEQRDGAELVEWIAGQPWCNGNVGMLGDSYFARTQWLIAAQRPPHLKCIVPFDGGTDEYRDSRHEGGLIRISWLAEWGFDTMLQCIWPGPVEGKLPPANLFVNYGNNPDDGPYYWERSGWKKLDRIDVPVLSIAVAQGRTHSRGQLWAYPRTKSPKKLIVAPPLGFHANTFLRRSKAINELILRWYDHWLKGIDTGIMKDPPVAIYDTVTKQWRYENEYPLKKDEVDEILSPLEFGGTCDEASLRIDEPGAAGKRGTRQLHDPGTVEPPGRRQTGACICYSAPERRLAALGTSQHCVIWVFNYSGHGMVCKAGRRGARRTGHIDHPGPAQGLVQRS